MNMLGQLMYGFSLEDFYGTKKYLILYLLSGIGGNLLSASINHESISVGASSSIFGLFALMGTYIY
jgi:rhomboid protease GluP